MGPLFILSLASQQAQWLALRQQTIAGNVANASTPGFRAQDVKPFAEVLDGSSGGMAVTNAAHIDASPRSAAVTARKAADGWETTLSGNSVSLEQEMMKAGDVHRAYAMNTSIVKAFDRMLLSSVKS